MLLGPYWSSSFHTNKSPLLNALVNPDSAKGTTSRNFCHSLTVTSDNWAFWLLFPAFFLSFPSGKGSIIVKH